MKYPVVLSIFILFSCGCNSNKVNMLLSEQKMLKDSANNIRERIGSCTQKGDYNSAKAKEKQLATVYARLIHIQSSIDDLNKIK